MKASLRTRILLVVLLGGIAPLAMVGFWIVRSGPQSGEDALRARLTETMEEIVGTTGQKWVVIRSRLLEFVEDPAIRELFLDPGAEGPPQDLHALFARYELADAVTKVIPGTPSRHITSTKPLHGFVELGFIAPSCWRLVSFQVLVKHHLQ